MNTKTKSGALIKTLTGLAAAALLFAACEYDAPHPFLINGEYELVKVVSSIPDIDLTLEKNGDAEGLYDLTLEVPSVNVSFKGTLTLTDVYDYSGSYSQILKEIDAGEGWVTYEEWNKNQSKYPVITGIIANLPEGISFGTPTKGDYTYYNSYKRTNSADSASDIDVKRALNLGDLWFQKK